jgi:hypothetical protein
LLAAPTILASLLSGDLLKPQTKASALLQRERIPCWREKPFLWIDVVIPATEPGDWQLLEKPLGVMPGRLHLTWEGDMPNDKPLKPHGFPVEVEGEELVTADGKPIAKAKTPAEDIAGRLNEDDQRKEQDRWSA